MNRSIPLLTVFAGLLTLTLTGCEIFRTEQQTQGEISEYVLPATVRVETIVRLQPATQQLKVGEATTVDILVENVADLYGAEFELEFEPGILQVLDANPNVDGVQISPGNFLAPEFVERNEADNALGRVHFEVAQIDPAPPANGSGLLANFTVQAVALGQSDLIFAAPPKLTNPIEEPILAKLEERLITVAAAGLPTITPTVPVPPTQPSPTETPLPPPPTPTPIPPPPPTSTAEPMAKIPPGATVGFCYRVQAGDTLKSIARQFNSNVKGIQLANDLTPPGHIYVQKALFVPTRGGKGPNVYVVQAGDTLATIADACNLPVDMLTWVNNLEEGVELIKGQLLEIPIPPFPPPSRFAYPPSVYPPPYTGPPKSYGY